MSAVVWTPMRKLTIAGLSVVAVVALALGIAYQGERLPEEPVLAGNATGAGGGGDDGATVEAAETGGVVDPIEQWFPQSGAGAACREPVGVDLIGGFGATLTINGISIAPEEMNVKLDEEGNPTNEITASRSLGHYTFGPEIECPNGPVLRARDNQMQACVYRLVEGPETCVVSRYSFDLA